MIALSFVWLLGAAPAEAPPAPTATPPKQEINKETRPDLFADEPPPRGDTAGDKRSETPPNETPTSFWVSNLLRTVLVLAAVLLLAYLILNKGLARLMKLTGVSVTGKHMTLIERLPLDQRHSLYLIEVSGRRYVVGTGEHTTSLVAKLDEAAPTSASQEPESAA